MTLVREPVRLSARFSEGYTNHFVLTQFLAIRNPVRDLQPFFRGQPHKLQPRTNVRGVTHDGDRSERLLPQSEINGDRVPDVHMALNQHSQAAFPNVKADAPRCLHATPA